jgi:hypothetical protein
VTITGNATNSGSVTINGTTANLTVDGTYTQAGSGATTLLNGGTFDPPAIDIEGGTFGGAGTVEGPATLSDDSTLQVGDPTGQLVLSGDYSQNGGEIIFDIESDGNGGFLESSVDFDSGANVTIDDANIVFDFIGEADPTAFSDGGLFNIDTFFTASDQSNFFTDFAGEFGDDTFTFEGTGLQASPLTLEANGNFEAAQNPAATPEPGTLMLLLPGIALLGILARRRHRRRDYTPVQFV